MRKNWKNINATIQLSTSRHLRGTDGVCEDIQRPKYFCSNQTLRTFGERSQTKFEEASVWKSPLTSIQSHVKLWALSNSPPPSPSSEKMIAPNYENICVSGKSRTGGRVMGETVAALRQRGGRNYNEER